MDLLLPADIGCIRFSAIGWCQLGYQLLEILSVGWGINYVSYHCPMAGWFASYHFRSSNITSTILERWYTSNIPLMPSFCNSCLDLMYLKVEEGSSMSISSKSRQTGGLNSEDKDGSAGLSLLGDVMWLQGVCFLSIFADAASGIGDARLTVTWTSGVSCEWCALVGNQSKLRAWEAQYIVVWPCGYT